MSIIKCPIRCPRCHGRLIQYTAILNKLDNSVIYYINYCPSIRCKVRKVILDKYNSILHIYYYKDLRTKKRVMYNILRNNWNKYSYKTKAKLKNKYSALVK